MPRYWSQGYGFEAARAWFEASFETMGLPRICAYADWHNTASRRILSKIGMRQGPQFLLEGVPCIWYEANAPGTK
jgi:RimJ/RimL family protein N-acetyltransferase